jgi:hypothetical protein
MTRVDAALPPKAGPAAARADTGFDGEAWRREMERAQMADWFHGPLTLRPANVEEEVTRASVLTPTHSHVPAAPSAAGATPAPAWPKEERDHKSKHESEQVEHAPATLQTLQRLDPAAAGLVEATHATEALKAGEPSVPLHPSRPASAMPMTAPAVMPSASASASASMSPASKAPASQGARARSDSPFNVTRLHEGLRSQLSPSVELAPLAIGPAAPPISVTRVINAQAQRPATEVSLPAASREMPILSRPRPTFAPTAPALEPQETETSAAMPARMRAQTSRAPQPDPVRATALWQDREGVLLWLGVDAAGLGELAPLMSRIETWLRSQGVRLLGVTCNGRRWPDPFTPFIPPQEDR